MQIYLFATCEVAFLSLTYFHTSYRYYYHPMALFMKMAYFKYMHVHLPYDFMYIFMWTRLYFNHSYYKNDLQFFERHGNYYDRISLERKKENPSKKKGFSQKSNQRLSAGYK